MNYFDKVEELFKNSISISEDQAYECVIEALKSLAWNIHIMISEGKSVDQLDKYVTDICDF